jgi:hypothetical protein
LFRLRGEIRAGSANGVHPDRYDETQGIDSQAWPANMVRRLADHVATLIY